MNEGGIDKVQGVLSQRKGLSILDDLHVLGDAVERFEHHASFFGAQDSGLWGHPSQSAQNPRVIRLHVVDDDVV